MGILMIDSESIAKDEGVSNKQLYFNRSLLMLKVPPQLLIELPWP